MAHGNTAEASMQLAVSRLQTVAQGSKSRFMVAVT